MSGRAARVAVVVGIAAAVAAAIVAPAQGALRVLAPKSDAVVRAKQLPIRVVIRSDAGARPRVTLRNRDVSNRFRRHGKRWVGRLGGRQGLRRGRNYIYARSGSGRGARLSSVRFLVVRRNGALLDLAAPAAASGVVRVRARHLPRLRRIGARLNGRPARAQPAPIGGRGPGWRPTGHRLSLAGHNGLRHGRNRLVVQAVDPRGFFDRERVSFSVPRRSPLASAGPDRVLAPREVARLSAAGARAGSGGELAFRWRIVRAPAGSKAKLKRANSRHPRLRPDVHGRYVIEQTVRERRRGAGARTAATGPPGRDWVVLRQVPEIPVSGMRLETQATANGGIKLGDKLYADDAGKYLKLVVIDGVTLEAKGSAYPPTIAGFNAFARRLQASGGKDIVVISCGGNAPAGADCLPKRGKTDVCVEVQDNPFHKTCLGARSALVYWLERLDLLPDAAIGNITADTYCWAFRPFTCKLRNDGLPAGPRFSLIGAPGNSERGFASILEAKDLDLSGKLTGWLQTPIAKAGVDYRFVSIENHDFDTRLHSGVGPGEVAMRIGGSVVETDRPAGGPGFHFISLDPQTLGVLGNDFYDSATELAAELKSFGTNKGLILLQSYGKPKPESGDWGRVARFLAIFGANRPLFNSLDGGRDYALVAGRRSLRFAFRRDEAALGAREAAHPGVELAGRLVRAANFDFAPAPATATFPGQQGDPDAIPMELFAIANEEPRPWSEGRAPYEPCAGAYVAKQLKLEDDAGRVVPEVRDYYPTHVTTQNWTNLSQELEGDALRYPGEAGFGCKPAPTEGQYGEYLQALRTEMLALGTLKQLIVDLQLPLRATGRTTEIEVVADDVYKSLNPPSGDVTAKVFAVTEGILRAIAVVAPVAPPEGTIAAGALNLIAAGMAAVEPFVAGGSPAESEAEFQTKADGLAKELGDKYAALGEQMESVAGQIAGDRGRLYAFAATGQSLIPSDAARNAAVDGVIVAARQLAYTTLLPLGYGAWYVGVRPKKRKPLNRDDYKRYRCEHGLRGGRTFHRTPRANTWALPRAADTGPNAAHNRRFLVLAPPTRERFEHEVPFSDPSRKKQLDTEIASRLTAVPDRGQSRVGKEAGFNPAQLFAAMSAEGPDVANSHCDKAP